MLDNKDRLPLTQQATLLGVSRSSFYYQSQVVEDKDLADMRLISEVLEKLPFYGYRRISRQLIEAHPHLTVKRARRVMKRFGRRAIYPGPKTSLAGKGHSKYPYLLRGKAIRHPNQVWATDITYIRLPGGYVYLVAILDLYSRKVLAWRLSNTMDSEFCIQALREALDTYGIPAIFNTDQGSQFTSESFVGVLESEGILVSMDGKGRALDNVYVERLWRSLKYEDIYLKSYETMKELKEGVKRYFEFYNSERFHQSHNYNTPMYESFSRMGKEENVA